MARCACTCAIDASGSSMIQHRLGSLTLEQVERIFTRYQRHQKRPPSIISVLARWVNMLCSCKRTTPLHPELEKTQILVHVFYWRSCRLNSLTMLERNTAIGQGSVKKSACFVMFINGSF